MRWMIQDGADFYDEETSKLIYAASFRVRDFDLDAAMAARREFEAWAAKNLENWEWHDTHTGTADSPDAVRVPSSSVASTPSAKEGA